MSGFESEFDVRETLYLNDEVLGPEGFPHSVEDRYDEEVEGGEPGVCAYRTEFLLCGEGDDGVRVEKWVSTAEIVENYVRYEGF